MDSSQPGGLEQKLPRTAINGGYEINHNFTNDTLDQNCGFFVHSSQFIQIEIM
jgi:hypothetical protein